MNHPRTRPARRIRPDRFARLSQRLEAMAERESQFSNKEKIAQLYQIMFGDDDEWEKSVLS